jgi:hypothetical protein
LTATTFGNCVHLLTDRSRFITKLRVGSRDSGPVQQACRRCSAGRRGSAPSVACSSRRRTCRRSTTSCPPRWVGRMATSTGNSSTGIATTNRLPWIAPRRSEGSSILMEHRDPPPKQVSGTRAGTPGANHRPGPAAEGRLGGSPSARTTGGRADPAVGLPRRYQRPTRREAPRG